MTVGSTWCTCRAKLDASHTGRKLVILHASCDCRELMNSLERSRHPSRIDVASQNGQKHSWGDPIWRSVVRVPPNMHLWKWVLLLSGVQACWVANACCSSVGTASAVYGSTLKETGWQACVARVSAAACAAVRPNHEFRSVFDCNGVGHQIRIQTKRNVPHIISVNSHSNATRAANPAVFCSAR